MTSLAVFFWNIIGAILIVFGFLFSLIYGAAEATGKKVTHQGEYWGLVIGLGIGAVVVGIFIMLMTYFVARSHRHMHVGGCSH